MNPKLDKDPISRKREKGNEKINENRVNEETLVIFIIDEENRLTFFFLFGVTRNAFILEKRTRKIILWKKEARRYVAFLSSTGTLPVSLPLPRDCPVNGEIGR